MEETRRPDGLKANQVRECPEMHIHTYMYMYISTRLHTYIYIYMYYLCELKYDWLDE